MAWRNDPLNRRDAFEFFRWQVVEIAYPSGRPDRSGSRYHQGRPSASPRMRNRDWPKDRGTGLQRACRWACRKWNTTGCRTVTCRICQQDRRLEARYQALVAIGRRVGEGVDRACMLNDTANVVQCGLRQIGILCAGKGALAVLEN